MVAIQRRRATRESPPAAVTVNACAKINLTLRVTGTRADGYHELRTIFQSVALHDTLSFVQVPGSFRIECDDPSCPTDRTNLVWRAAELMWRAAGHRGAVRDLAVRIAKRIPLQAGLGGGSSDAAATLRALGRLWHVALPREASHEMAKALGADVPFFLDGGTALGLGRGDLLFPLAECARAWVTLLLPAFGINTKEAFAWWDGADGDPLRGAVPGKTPRRLRSPSRALPSWTMLPADELRNDLEPSVAAHHPEIGRLVSALRRHGAEYAAMSGSGSTVFGLFSSKTSAGLAARALSRASQRSWVTETVGRRRYAKLTAPS